MANIIKQRIEYVVIEKNETSLLWPKQLNVIEHSDLADKIYSDESYMIFKTNLY